MRKFAKDLDIGDFVIVEKLEGSEVEVEKIDGKITAHDGQNICVYDAFGIRYEVFNPDYVLVTML